MSSNKSQNLKLHLWEPEDDFLRTEFNENFSAIDAAVKADRAAIAMAQSTAEEKPYVVGNYVGTGKEMHITVGFKPSSVLIFSDQKQVSTTHAVGRFSAAGRLVGNEMVTMTDTGFTLAAFDQEFWYPMVNYKTFQYEYIAFK